MSNVVQLPGMTFPPVSWWIHALRFDTWHIAENEFWAKQSFRNRYEIAGPNDRQKLVIPVHRPIGSSGRKVPMHEITIAYEEDWYRVHIKTLESAYRKSPFYAFYEDQVNSILNTGYGKLSDLNLNAILWCAKVLDLDKEIRLSSEAIVPIELAGVRKQLSSLNSWPEYIQVFDERHGFMSDLSILDLVFNLGPEASVYLRNVLDQL